MRLGELIKKSIKDCGDDGDRYMELNTMGSIINMLQEGIDELSYDDISETWQELIDLIQNKREDLWNKEIKQ